MKKITGLVALLCYAFHSPRRSYVELDYKFKRRCFFTLEQQSRSETYITVNEVNFAVLPVIIIMRWNSS